MEFIAIMVNVLIAWLLKNCVDCAMSRKAFGAVLFGVMFVAAFVINYHLYVAIF